MIIYAIVSAWLILFAIITLGSKIDPTTEQVGEVS